MAGRWSRGAYRVGNTFLPLTELSRTLAALRGLFTGMAVGGATAAQKALRGAREAAEQVDGEGKVFEAPDRRWLVRQWRAGMALLVVGICTMLIMWIATGLLAKITLAILGLALAAAGLAIAGSMSFLARKTALPDLTFDEWLRRPTIGI